MTSRQSPNARERGNWKQWFLWTAIPLMLIGAPICAYDATGRAALNRSLKEAREIDPLLTFEEIEAARQTWPDDQNGALHIQTIFPVLEANESTIASDDLLPLLGKADMPPLGRRWSTANDAHVAAFLGSMSAELDAIDELIAYEGGRFEIDYADHPFDTLLPHLKSLRTATKLKALEAAFADMHGQSRNVVADFEIIRRPGELLKDEPFVISSLVAIAVESFANLTLHTTLAHRELTDNELRQLSMILKSPDTTDSLYWGLLGERAGSLDIVDWVKQTGGQANVKIPFAKLGNVPGIRGLLYRDEAMLLRLGNLWLQAVKDPANRTALLDEAEQLRATLPRTMLITSMLAPSLHRTFTLQQRLRAETQILLAGLASERHRLQQGRWPETLDALTPTLLEAVPADPFDGKPLRYQHFERGVIIYSIDEDGVDDQGDVTDRRLRDEPRRAADLGMTLLDPEYRNLPPLPPEDDLAASAPAEAQ